MAPELRVRVAEMCEWDTTVFALGDADVALIPHFASSPSLPVKQRTCREAMRNTRGPPLLAALAEHLQAFWASDDDWLSLGDDETLDVILAACQLRAGRGPEPFLSVDQDACPARLEGVPDEVHVDLAISASLARRHQAPWLVPRQASCLVASSGGQRSDYGEPLPLEVRGRHSFVCAQHLDRISLSDIDLTRGRLDFSAIKSCALLEMWSVRVGAGDFGIRWPAKVTAMRMLDVTFAKQSAAFALPSGLVNLDLSRTPLAQGAPQWELPSSLKVLELYNSPLAGRVLPRTLPATLETLSCRTNEAVTGLRGHVFPEGLREVEFARERNEPLVRKTKLFKRNWQREVKKHLPQASVYIR